MSGALPAALTEAARVLDLLRHDPEALDALQQVEDACVQAIGSGDKIIAAGNGGSLADAVHFCEELTGRFRNDRRPYPALALADAAHITCTANDFGYDRVFERGVQAFAKPGDVVLLLSTSGNSQNLVLAAKAARVSRAKVVAFVGRGGGKLAAETDLCACFPGETSDRIQELHMIALHALVQAIEERISG